MLSLCFREEARIRHSAAIKYIRMAHETLAGGAFADPNTDMAGVSQQATASAGGSGNPNSLLSGGAPASSAAPSSQPQAPKVTLVPPPPPGLEPMTPTLEAEARSPSEQRNSDEEGNAGKGGGPGAKELPPGASTSKSGFEPGGAEKGARYSGSSKSGGGPEEEPEERKGLGEGARAKEKPSSNAGEEEEEHTGIPEPSPPDWSAVEAEMLVDEAEGTAPKEKQEHEEREEQKEKEEKQKGAGPKTAREGRGAEKPAGEGDAPEDTDGASGQNKEQKGRNTESGQNNEQGGGQGSGDGDPAASSQVEPAELIAFKDRKGFPTLEFRRSGMTILHCAAEDSEADLVSVLCRLCPSFVNMPAAGPKCIRMTPLHVAAQGVKAELIEKRLQCIRHLVEAGADLEAKKEKDMTPFLVAAATGFLPGLQLLQRLGSNLNAQTTERCTAMNLTWASRQSQAFLSAMGVRKGPGQLGSGRLD